MLLCSLLWTDRSSWGEIWRYGRKLWQGKGPFAGSSVGLKWLGGGQAWLPLRAHHQNISDDSNKWTSLCESWETHSDVVMSCSQRLGWTEKGQLEKRWQYYGKLWFFPVIMYGCGSWTIKKAEHGRIDALELWCWRRLLRVPWTARRSNQSILKEINPKYSLGGLMLKLKLQYFGHLVRRAYSLEKTLMLGKMEGRRRREWQKMRWLDGITQWTWVWANLGTVKVREAWRAAVPGVTKSQTQLSDTTATTREGVREGMGAEVAGTSLPHWKWSASQPVWDWGFLLRMLCCIGHVQLFVTPWTEARLVPLSMEFPRQEYWSGLPFPSSGDLPYPGVKPRSLLHCR